jgi:hypothetical protein
MSVLNLLLLSLFILLVILLLLRSPVVSLFILLMTLLLLSPLLSLLPNGPFSYEPPLMTRLGNTNQVTQISIV